MTDLFISYSRRDLDFVQQLYNSLKAQQRDIWIDLEDIPPTAEWLQEIYTGIEAANAFVFVISPHSAESEVCRLEIEHAVKHNKKLVPILREDVPDRTRLHGSLASHNWLFFRPQDEFERAFKLLNDALDTDLSYVRFHTRLLVRALEWDSRRRDASFLLRGTDLSDAEQWLSESMGKQPTPTQLHTQYIFASRQAETRRQRFLLIGVTAALVVSVVLGAVAFIQWREADAARLKASQAQGTAVAALISVNDTRATAQAQEDTFRATIRALGVIAREEEALAADSGDEPQTTILAPLTPVPVQLTATALAEILYEPSATMQTTATALAATRTLPDTAGGGDPGTLLLVTLAQYQGAQTDAERFEAQNTLVDVLQRLSGRSLRGHNGPILSVTYNPAGTLLASGGDDNTIILWDAVTLERVGLPFYGHSAGITSLDFSPDGRILASASRDGSVILWDVTSGEIIHSLQERDNNWVLSLAFSADGSRLFSSGSNPVVKVWDVASGTLATELSGLDATAFTLAASPDGQLVAAGDSTGTIILWDADTWAEVARLAGHDGAVFSIQFSPDSRLLATGGADNRALLWDVASGELLHTLRGAENVLLSVAFSPDGTILAAGTAENVVRLWDVASGALLGDAYRGYGDWVYSVAYSPDGSTLASGSSDGVIVVWPVGIEAWTAQVCSVANRNLTETEWADFIPDQPYRELCPGL